MKLLRELNDCGLVIREYLFDGVYDDSFMVDIYMADYVEIIVLKNGRRIHQPYHVVPLYTGGVMLVNAMYYPDGKVRAHRHSVCPFNKCRHALGPLSSVRFVVRVINMPKAPPFIKIT